LEHLETDCKVIIQLNIQLYSLALKCPFNLGCTACPLIEIRKMDIGARFDYLDQLSFEDSEKLFKEHYNNYCLHYRFDANELRSIL